VLLERSDQLAALAEALDAVLADGAGTLVFVGGEASAEAQRLGIGAQDR
jgi:hypothetical protein